MNTIDANPETLRAAHFAALYTYSHAETVFNRHSSSNHPDSLQELKETKKRARATLAHLKLAIDQAERLATQAANQAEKHAKDAWQAAFAASITQKPAQARTLATLADQAAHHAAQSVAIANTAHAIADTDATAYESRRAQEYAEQARTCARNANASADDCARHYFESVPPASLPQPIKTDGKTNPVPPKLGFAPTTGNPKSPSAATPQQPMTAIERYLEIKHGLPDDTILLYRIGDFYEVFNQDAATVAKIIGLVITKRNDVPMCGLPAWSLTRHLETLRANGKKIAVSEGAHSLTRSVQPI